MELLGIEFCLLRRRRHGGHGVTKSGCCLRLMEPESVVGNGLDGLDHPGPGFWTVDQDSAASELLAKGELAAGPDLLNDGLTRFHARLLFVPSCCERLARCVLKAEQRARSAPPPPGVCARMTSRSVPSQERARYLLERVMGFMAAVSLKVASKGQITLRRELLKHLGIQPGQRVEVEVLPGGRLELHAERATGEISGCIGLLARRSSRTASLEELSDAVAAGWQPSEDPCSCQPPWGALDWLAEEALADLQAGCCTDR